MISTGNKRILICGTQVPFVRGGAEKLVDTLAAKLKEQGHTVDTVMIPFQWYPRENILRTALAWRLLDITESAHNPVDLVIATKFPSYFVRHPNKVVWLVHQHRGSFDHYTTPYSPFRNSPGDNQLREKIMEYEKQFLSEAKGLFAISGNVAGRLQKYLGLEAEPLYPPLYNIERYHSEKSGDYILSVSRIEEDKRVGTLVKAMALCPKKIKAKIVGVGNQLPELKKTAAELGVADRVEFLGAVSDDQLYDLYAGCFAVYFAPWDEDYGYITIEAFQSSKPVITSEQSGGTLEFVENGVNGFITDGSAERAAEAMQRLFEDKKLSERFGEAGFKRVQSITWEHTINRLLSAC
jgi:glycosyltransferase involved in cell wall biosynthesis